MLGSGDSRWSLRGCIAVAGLGLLVAFTTVPLVGQEVFHRGQNVVPVYEGWETNPDGSFNLVFGYLNRNYEEHLHIPVGPDNSLEPGFDQGQPTYFFPRRHRFIFRIRVPSNFGDKEIVWTLRAHGRTERAYATLLPDYAIEDDMIAFDASVVSNMARTPENVAPAIRIIGENRRTVAVGEPLSLSALVADDGLPVPPDDEALRNSRSGLSVTWFVYRGPAETVAFEPEQQVFPYFLPGPEAPPPPPADGAFEVSVGFSEPGEYVIRATALDGVLWTDQDVTVTVTP
jgi:hypothetical protein